jgi:superfamily I DNA and/or RNA helicase
VPLKIVLRGAVAFAARIGKTGNQVEKQVSRSGVILLSCRAQGNQSPSPEEVERVCALVDQILTSDTSWVDQDGVEAPVALKAILIIAPYNAQVFALREWLPNAFIGTLDKFQGQEAPIVIYSMTSSSHADAPRVMEFLYSANRLNVAVSRAKCICVVVPRQPCSRRSAASLVTASGKKQSHPVEMTSGATLAGLLSGSLGS